MGVHLSLALRLGEGPHRPRLLDAEAKLIALVCSRPPKGRKRWTLTLLETAVVELSDNASPCMLAFSPASSLNRNLPSRGYPARFR